MSNEYGGIKKLIILMKPELLTYIILLHIPVLYSVVWCEVKYLSITLQDSTFFSREQSE